MMRALIREAERRGGTAGENPIRGGVNPVHVSGSWHDKRFKGSRVGRAVDINFSGNEGKQLRALFRWFKRTYGLNSLQEALLPGRTYFAGGDVTRSTYKGHDDHGHFAI